jgi:hypothetical protein
MWRGPTELEPNFENELIPVGVGLGCGCVLLRRKRVEQQVNASGFQMHSELTDTFVISSHTLTVDHACAHVEMSTAVPKPTITPGSSGGQRCSLPLGFPIGELFQRGKSFGRNCPRVPDPDGKSTPKIDKRERIHTSRQIRRTHRPGQ